MGGREHIPYTRKTAMCIVTTIRSYFLLVTNRASSFETIKKSCHTSYLHLRYMIIFVVVVIIIVISISLLLRAFYMFFINVVVLYFGNKHTRKNGTKELGEFWRERKRTDGKAVETHWVQSRRNQRRDTKRGTLRIPSVTSLFYRTIASSIRLKQKKSNTLYYDYKRA